jgi:hypothetical protein
MTTHENNTVSRPERKRRALPQKKSASNAATEPCPYDSSLLPRARLILELTNPRTGEVLSVEPISDDFSACESNAGGLMWKIAIARDNFAQTVYKGEDGEEVQMSPGGGTVSSRSKMTGSMRLRHGQRMPCSSPTGGLGKPRLPLGAPCEPLMGV